jgi:hypothetical protein
MARILRDSCGLPMQNWMIGGAVCCIFSLAIHRDKRKMLTSTQSVKTSGSVNCEITRALSDRGVAARQ